MVGAEVDSCSTNAAALSCVRGLTSNPFDLPVMRRGAALGGVFFMTTDRVREPDLRRVPSWLVTECDKLDNGLDEAEVDGDRRLTNASTAGSRGRDAALRERP